jgi:hypothetical protein
MSATIENKIKIELDQPKKRLKHETLSKFLNDQSELYFFVKDCQERIKHSGFRLTDRLEPCVEILNLHERGKKEELELYLKRCQEIHGKEIDVFDRANYAVVGKKLVLLLPVVENKRLQVTIASFNTMCINKDRFLNLIINQNYNYGNDYDESFSSQA